MRETSTGVHTEQRPPERRLNPWWVARDVSVRVLAAMLFALLFMGAYAVGRLICAGALHVVEHREFAPCMGCFAGMFCWALIAVGVTAGFLNWDRLSSALVGAQKWREP